MMQIGAFAFTRDITVWNRVPSDSPYGGFEWDTPVLLKCWFAINNERFVNKDGQEQVGNYEIMMGADAKGKVGYNSFVVLDQDLTAVADPTSDSSIPAFEVKSFGYIACDGIGSLDVVEVRV